jgi:glycosyltransferase involved in cell wall biosynthesis
MKRVACIVQLPKGVSPGQRFRIELWEPVLHENNIQTDTFPFLDQATHKIIYKPGNTLKKITGVIKGFARRFALLPKLRKYDFLFVQREFSPVGPPVFEWICAKLLRCKIIYDYDDAIWIPNTSGENKLANAVKAFWKIKYICKWAYKVVPGNDYLAAFARKYNDNVVLIPTCVDTERMHNKVKQHTDGKPVIGWTGSHSTLKYLDELMPALQQLQEEIDFTFLVIADKKPELPLKDWQFVPWNAQTEIDDLLRMDAGVMPLTADNWSEGKCGFKLIQYLALGIPAAASPVGVNKVIIEEGVNGYLCDSNEAWVNGLKKLITDAALRKQMGLAGRKKIVAEYSVASQKEKFLSLFS